MEVLPRVGLEDRGAQFSEVVGDCRPDFVHTPGPVVEEICSEFDRRCGRACPTVFCDVRGGVEGNDGGGERLRGSLTSSSLWGSSVLGRTSLACFFSGFGGSFFGVTFMTLPLLSRRRSRFSYPFSRWQMRTKTGLSAFTSTVGLDRQSPW